MTADVREPAPGERLPRGFHLLLIGQTVSLVGSAVTFLALPLTAIDLLGAGPFETGVLLACGRAPYLLCGPVAGVLVDRLPHRVLLMSANTVMAVALATVPIAALTGHVGLPHLYTAATVVGTATVLADVAYLACVPNVVPPTQLVRAQSRLELGQSIAVALGPLLAGWLIGTFSAPTAIFADSASFLLATALLPFVAMRPAEYLPAHGAAREHDDGRRAHGGILSEAAEGALFVLRTARLRAVTLATATLVFCYNAYSAVFLLYLTERLGFSAGASGAAMGIAAAGGIAGALAARSLARGLGLGRVLVASLVLSAIGAVLTPVAAVTGWAALLAVALSHFLLWAGQQIYNVHQVPIRYVLTPRVLHGRVNASIRTIVWGLAPLGALLGGACGAWFGTRATLLLSGAAIAFAAAWIVRSPLWAVRTPQLAGPGTPPAHSETAARTEDHRP
ncbi:MFS transporter [Streptomyces caeruleatus]|uniref:MFS transporter n=1 Tax=Streptomyces caeruleatus TaxID=661399 RepID=UPI0007C761D5|nr:MFS transporter [Streptomyces caeruleatus]